MDQEQINKIEERIENYLFKESEVTDNEKPEEDILKNFVKLVHMYVSHSLRNRIDLISNKDKWNAIYSHLNEFDSLIKQWEQ